MSAQPIFISRNTPSPIIKNNTPSDGVRLALHTLFQYQATKSNVPINPIHISENIPPGFTKHVDVQPVNESPYTHERNYFVLLALSPELVESLGDKVSMYLEHANFTPAKKRTKYSYVDEEEEQKKEYISLKERDSIQPSDMVHQVLFEGLTGEENRHILDSLVVFEEGEKREGNARLPNGKLHCIYAGELAVKIVVPLLTQEGRETELTEINKYCTNAESSRELLKARK